jgi:hypothetical protein
MKPLGREVLDGDGGLRAKLIESKGLDRGAEVDDPTRWYEGTKGTEYEGYETAPYPVLFAFGEWDAGRARIVGTNGGWRGRGRWEAKIGISPKPRQSE